MPRAAAPAKIDQPNALVAAAKRVDLTRKKQIRKPEEWQSEAWGYFDEVPEIKYATWYLGNQAAKAILFVGYRDPANPDADPIPVTDEASPVEAGLAGQAMAELDRLKGPLGGRSEIQRELNMNLELAGECYLVGRAERTVIVKDPVTGEDIEEVHPEEWEVRSVDELFVKDGKYLVRSAPDDKGSPLSDGDTVIRIWQKHPRYSLQADCAMRGVLFDCQILQSLSQQVLAEANSRQSAGILAVPSELSFGPVDQSDADDRAGDDVDVLTEEIGDALGEPIGDPSSPFSVAPLILRGPAEYLQAIARIDLSRTSDESLDARIDKRIDRIARGLNLPVEVVMGHQQTTFANARQVDQDEFDDHLEPRLGLICDALTTGFLHPNLIDAGRSPDEIADLVVWFDPVNMIRSPDQEANADKALGAGLISDAAGRRAYGFSEDDAPDEEDSSRMAAEAERLAQLAQKLYLGVGVLYTAEDARSIMEMAGMEFSDPAPPPPAAPTPAQGEAAAMAHAAALLAAGVSPPKASAPGGADLLAIDRELRTRLTVAADDAMTRALERAGNRLRTKVSADLRRTIGELPADRRAGMLGPALVAAAGVDEDDLLAGAFDELERQFRQWSEQAGGDAIEVAHRISGGFSTYERQALKLRMADDLDEAWGWMKEALTSLAAAKLYDPTPDIGFGEFDPTSKVPTGLVRQAMARAGGQKAFTTDGQDAWVALDAEGRPAGGIGTGRTIGQALTEKGVGREGYRWVYGAGFRRTNFPPHLRLDGVTFENFDDPVLAVSGSFPARDFYMPGDHAGCQCDFEPILLPPADEGGQQVTKQERQIAEADERAKAATARGRLEPGKLKRATELLKKLKGDDINDRVRRRRKVLEDLGFADEPRRMGGHEFAEELSESRRPFHFNDLTPTQWDGESAVFATDAAKAKADALAGKSTRLSVLADDARVLRLPKRTDLAGRARELADEAAEAGDDALQTLAGDEFTVAALEGYDAVIIGEGDDATIFVLNRGKVITYDPARTIATRRTSPLAGDLDAPGSRKLGDLLTLNPGDAEYEVMKAMRTQVDEIDALPDAVVRRLAEQGIRVHVTSGPVNDFLNMAEDARTNDGRLWREVAGIFSSGGGRDPAAVMKVDRAIMSRSGELTTYGRGVMRHELGHALDYTLRHQTDLPGVDSTASFVSSQDGRFFQLWSEVKRVAGRQMDPYFTGEISDGPAEFFAEAFSIWTDSVGATPNARALRFKRIVGPGVDHETLTLMWSEVESYFEDLVALMERDAASPGFGAELRSWASAAGPGPVPNFR